MKKSAVNGISRDVVRMQKAQSIVGTSPGRPEDDFYPTPPEMTQALLNNHKFDKAVWEPACGDGAMSEVLFMYDYDVLSTDLVYRDYGVPASVDFLKCYHRANKCIITNPPYKLAEKFIYHAFELGCNQLALLLKLSFLEGQKRKAMFAQYPPNRVLVFSKRQKITRNGNHYDNGGMIAYAWFVWDYKMTNKKPEIDWI